MRIFNELVILFFIFSVLGWIMEVILKFIQYHRFINRGFLIGPYCPIYGWGVVSITFLIGNIAPFLNNYLATFLAGMIICGSLEYFTSFYLEKMFHARWWDYSQKPFNLHGRIWLGNIILFGIASTLIIKIIDPLYFDFIDQFSNFSLMIFVSIIITVMGIDYIVSHFVLADVKKSIDNANSDNTEEISKAVLNILKDKGYLLRRIKEAYPNFKVRPQQLVKDIQLAKKTLELKRKQLRKAIDEANEESIKKLHAEYNKAVDIFIEKRNRYKL